ncbi:MAG: thymidine kinase [Anaerolineae bacterium]|nr:thymidine kinase [Anaerolineae bacterium]
MKHLSGRVEVICGSMFSGKTEELIRRVRRLIIARQQVQVFKPAIDTRYSIQRVTSHNGQDFEAYAVGGAQDIFDQLADDTTVVAIDEAQFFDPAIARVVELLSARGMRVIVAGLDMDFRGEPFGSMPVLLSRADDVQKLHAICMVCGEDASRTQRLVDGQPARYDDPVIMVGAAEAYEARCRKHHDVPGHPMFEA